MESSYSTNFLYEIISKCAQSEFDQSTPSMVKTAHSSLGLKTNNKKKDDLINDIYRFLSNILVKQGANTQMRDGFPLFNSNNELFQRSQAIQHLVEVCNQKIHIANLHLAQINFNRLNQFKKSLNLSEGQSLCICNQTIDSNSPVENLIKCINPKCGRFYHRACFGVGSNPDDYPLFECPDCVLFKSDPLHEVIKTLVAPFLVDNQTREFRIDDMISREIKSNEAIGIEVRAIRLETKSHEHSWPHQGYLELNNTKLLEFKPLQHNSSLKKRRDERFFSNDVIAGTNSVKLFYTKGSDSRNPDKQETYFAAIYLVKKLSSEELVQKIKNENKRSVEDCKKLIVDEFKNSPVEMNKVTARLTCVYDTQPIKTPAKGLHCKHPDCFSLENYVNLWHVNKQRKWTCPLCKVKAYDLIVDGYFEEILEAAKNSSDKSITNIEILRNGDYRFAHDEEENVNGESHEDQSVAVKVEKPSEKNPDLIILDSDEEEQQNKGSSAANEKKVSNQSERNDSGAMEEEKESPQNNEEGIASQNLLEKNDIVIHIGAMDSHQANGMMEESLDQDGNPGIDIEGEGEGEPSSEGNKEKSDKMIEEPNPTEKNTDSRMETEKEPEPEPKQSKPTKEKSKSSEKEKEPNEGKQTKITEKTGTKRSKPAAAPIDQAQQNQLSEEYKLQQLLQQYQQQQRMQLFNEALSLPQLMGNLQNLQGMANLLGMFGGGNMNLFQQQLNPFLMQGLLSKMQQQQQQQQQQASRGSMEDILTLLMSGGDTSNAYAGMNNPLAPFLRNANELSLLNALRMNLNGVPQLNNLASLQELYNLQQQQQQQQQTKNDGPSMNARSMNSPSFSNLSNPVKPPTMISQSKPAVEKSAPVEDPNDRMAVETIPIVPRKVSNRPKVFTIERERPYDRVMTDATKNIDKLIELSEKKLELPRFSNFKEVVQEEAKKQNETDLRKNKKLVALIMKQFPFQFKSKASKQTDGQEMVTEPTNPTPIVASTTNGQMEIEESKDKEATPQEANPANTGNIGNQGQESDPICLE